MSNRNHLLQDVGVPESYIGTPTDFFQSNNTYFVDNTDGAVFYGNDPSSQGLELEQEYTPDQQAPPRKDKEQSKVLFLLQKFTLYETRTHFYIVGSNAREIRFRILEIDLRAPKEQLAIHEWGGPYNRHEVMEVLANFEDENKSNGGFTKRLTAWGIMGFVRFTMGYYMSVITKRSAVALIGGHYVYHIDDTQLIPLCHSSLHRKPDRRSEENRYLTTFQSLDLSKTFYYSYTYDITQTLQTNLVREKRNLEHRKERKTFEDYNEMFVWNHALLEPFIASFENSIRWCLPIIHGFMDQAKIDIFGRTVYITIIARRSQYFAGARFLKRGANVHGRVANEVETEQIVADINVSSFHDPLDGLFNNHRYTSYVQHRGSIPLFWSQDVTNMSPKPPIELNAPDPFFAAAALHFDDMFERYGPNIRILNLIKRREKHAREMKLGFKFTECIKYLNQFLPEENQLHYTAWDMSRASRSRDQDVIEFLEKYADETLQRTGFFHNGGSVDSIKIQSGVCRTNCIDCLDRTNAAQFVIAKKALGYQLHILGVISNTDIEYDSDAVDLLTEMFHDHGDTIALQYGGSHLVNTVETYRKINQWTSHSRDLIENIRRFYSNSFIDAQRQDAINLFLGNFQWKEGVPGLWDLSTDYYLHNNLSISNEPRRSYVKWWTPSHLQSAPEKALEQIRYLHEKIVISENPQINEFLIQRALLTYLPVFDNYWNEYYKPRLYTALHNLFAFNMNSTLRYAPQNNDERAYLLGPFKTRKPIASHRHNKPKDKQLTTVSTGKQKTPLKSSRSREQSSVSSSCADIPALVETHKLHDRHQKLETVREAVREDITSSTTRIGALVQASSRFYKTPSFHRLLSEPARLSERIWGGLKGEETIQEKQAGGRRDSTDSSLGGSFVIGSNLEDSYAGNKFDFMNEESYNEKPLETMLDDLLNPSVPESEMHVYRKYAGFEELMAPVIDPSAAAVPPPANRYPYAQYSRPSYGPPTEPVTAAPSAASNFGHSADYGSTTNLRNLDLYRKSLSVYDHMTEDISFQDQRVYEFAYNLCNMNPSKTVERRQPYLSDFLDKGFLSRAPGGGLDSCDMGHGSLINVVPEENVQFYSDWLDNN